MPPAGSIFLSAEAKSHFFCIFALTLIPAFRLIVGIGQKANDTRSLDRIIQVLERRTL